MSSKFRVIADERERLSGIPELLKVFGLQVEYRMLDVGDYIVSHECAVERKQERDFLKSLYSGRLFDQVHRLCEVYTRPILVVEGEMPIVAKQMTKPRAFWGALTTLTFQYGLNIFFTAEAKQTADFIYTLTTIDILQSQKDLLRDFLPPIKRLKPTVRLFAKDFVWCSLDPNNLSDVKRIESILRGTISDAV